MKIASTVVAALLIGSFTVASANEEVDTQITAIQAATTSEERVELINDFKVLLADMNAEDRQAAIDELRGTMQSLSEEGSALQTRTQTRTQSRLDDGAEDAEGEALQTQTRTQTRTQDRMTDMSQTDQMNQVQNMNQVQQMNQKQVGSQLEPGSVPRGRQ